MTRKGGRLDARWGNAGRSGMLNNRRDASYAAALLALTVAGCGAQPPQPAQEPQGAPTTTAPASATVQPTETSAKPRPVSQQLLDAAGRGATEQVRAALEGGISGAGVGPEGRTLLMMAAFDGHTETVELLLEHGAEVNARDGAGRTALMYAASGPNATTCELLLKHGAEPDVADAGEGWTALMFAAGEGQAAVVETLLRHGADPSLADTDGDAAIAHARRNSHTAVVKLLSDQASS